MKKIKVALLSQNYCLSRTKQGNIKYMVKLIERFIISHQIDLICLPEAFSARNVEVQHVRDVAESVDGQTFQIFSNLAQKGRCNVICPIYTQQNDKFYNSALVIDRNGELIGIYNKLHPTATKKDFSEFEKGVDKGKNDLQFNLDFGNICIKICSDIYVSDTWRNV